MDKRIVVISDLHCGHKVGLTPPGFRQEAEVLGDNGDKILKMQKTLWNKYTDIIDSLRPIHIAIVNGDCIEGTGKRSGGTELLTSDQGIQVQMATKCIEYLDAEKIVMTYGTPYHVSDAGTDFERDIARNVGAEKIESHGFYEINGVTFDVKHKPASNTTVPTSNMQKKDWVSNVLWADMKQQPKADIVIRSHVHKYEQLDNGQILAFTTPGLQGFGSKFGSRQCSQVVHWGLISIDITAKGDVSWERFLYRGVVLQSKVVSL